MKGVTMEVVMAPYIEMSNCRFYRFYNIFSVFLEHFLGEPSAFRKFKLATLLKQSVEGVCVSGRSALLD